MKKRNLATQCIFALTIELFEDLLALELKNPKTKSYFSNNTGNCM